MHFPRILARFRFLLLFLLITTFTFHLPSVQFGGYGELHLNIARQAGYERTATLDFHRFVLFTSHQFTDRWSFFSEMELEHNFVKNGQGELELEQAYIQYRPAEFFALRFGVILPKVGIINDQHEPPLFLSVERPDYHKSIIPTTWFGNGMAITGSFQNFHYQLTLMESLDGDKFSAENGIRNARRKGFVADVRNPLINFNLDYKTSVWFTGFSITHNQSPSKNGNIPMTLLEGHFKYEAHNLYLVAELAQITYGEPLVLERSNGFYLDLGYNIAPGLKLPGKLYTWIRFSRFNTGAALRDASLSIEKNLVAQWLFGLSYKPIPEVVIKADTGFFDKDSVRTTQFNLGVGYMF